MVGDLNGEESVLQVFSDIWDFVFDMGLCEFCRAPKALACQFDMAAAAGDAPDTICFQRVDAP